jgi:hypothetical protein
MKLLDILVAPFVLAILYGLAFLIRPSLVDNRTKAYFIPALSLKFFGALMVGVIYQFYYRGGDTFNYFTYGSYHIGQAFFENPLAAISLIFGENEYNALNFNYASRIWFFRDDASYSVVRVAGFFSPITLNTYVGTAFIFAFISFTGVWVIYTSFVGFFPKYTKQLAYTVLFVPSVFFWGSGLLKDTLTIAALGWLFYGLSNFVLQKGSVFKNAFWIIVGIYFLFVIKIYVLLCFLPAAIFWFFLSFKSRIRSAAVRILALPILFSAGAIIGYYALINLSASSARYSLDNLLYTAEETGRWIHFVSDNEGGSSYSFGDYDFSPTGLLRKFIPATATTFFRPFLWEVRNPVMLLAALENAVLLGFFILILLRLKNLKLVVTNPLLLFCIIFSIAFGFAVGVTSYNFGALVRYKIPILPFLYTAFYLLSRKNLKI